MPLAQPGAAGRRARRRPTPTRRSPPLAAYVASLGPGPAIPDESDYSVEGLSDEEREEAIARGGQIFLTNCTACHNFDGSGGAMPRGGYAPKIRGVEPQLHLRGDADRPAGRCRTSPTATSRPRRSATSSPTSSSLDEQPSYGGFGLGGLGPVTEGLFAWLVGIGGLVGFAVWIAAHTTRSTKKKVDGMSDTTTTSTSSTPVGRRPRRTPPTDRRAVRQPGPARAHLAPDRRRPEGREARRAPGRRALRAVGGLHGPLRRLLLRLRRRRRPGHRRRPRRLQRRPRPDPGPAPAASSASASSSGPAS